jgi:hypothetical protein
MGNKDKEGFEMNIRYLSVVLGLFLIMTTVYVPAGADGTDTKLYAGATCVPTTGPHVHAGGFAGGTITNFSEVSLSVFCPVVRNVPRGQEFGVKVTIWVVDLHPEENADDPSNVFDIDNVFCTLDSRDNPKVSLNSVGIATAASEGASPDVQELEIPPRTSAPRGYYVLQCNIPAAVEGGASSIIAYEVVERQ